MKYTDKQFNSSFNALRVYIDNSGYGSFISDTTVREIVKVVLNAA